MKRLAVLAVGLTLSVTCCSVMSAPDADATRNPKPCWMPPHPTCDKPVYP